MGDGSLVTLRNLLNQSDSIQKPICTIFLVKIGFFYGHGNEPSSYGIIIDSIRKKRSIFTLFHIQAIISRKL